MVLSGPFAWAPPWLSGGCSQIPSGCIPGGTRRIFDLEKTHEHSDEGREKFFVGEPGKQKERLVPRAGFSPEAVPSNWD